MVSGILWGRKIVAHFIGGYCSVLEDVFMIFEDGFPSKSKPPFGRDFLTGKSVQEKAVAFEG